MGIRGRFLFLLWIVDPFSLLLHDHLKTAIESMYERCFEVIGTEKEYNWEYRRTLGIVHTACMYRRLLPSNIALQMIIFIDPCFVHCTVPIETKRPMVPLFGALPFFPTVHTIGQGEGDDESEHTIDDIKAAANKTNLFERTILFLIKVLAWMVETETRSYFNTPRISL